MEEITHEQNKALISIKYRIEHGDTIVLPEFLVSFVRKHLKKRGVSDELLSKVTASYEKRSDRKE